MAKTLIFTCGAQKGNWLLTKRSTGVDQNFRSWKVMSQLSVAIFIAPRTHFPAQESIISLKNVQKTCKYMKYPSPPWYGGRGVKELRRKLFFVVRMRFTDCGTKSQRKWVHHWFVCDWTSTSNAFGQPFRFPSERIWNLTLFRRISSEK